MLNEKGYYIQICLHQLCSILDATPLSEHSGELMWLGWKKSLDTEAEKEIQIQSPVTNRQSYVHMAACWHASLLWSVFLLCGDFLIVFASSPVCVYNRSCLLWTHTHTQNALKVLLSPAECGLSPDTGLKPHHLTSTKNTLRP